MKNQPHSLLIALILIAAALLGLLGAGIYYIRSMNEEIATLLYEAEHSSEAAVLAQDIRVAREEARGDIEAFDNMALSSDSSVLLIEEIEDAGSALKLNTRIIKVDTVDSKNPGEPKMLSLTVESLGPWAENLSFLKAIESLPYRVVVDEVRLNKEELNWRLMFVLKLHLFNSNG